MTDSGFEKDFRIRTVRMQPPADQQRKFVGERPHEPNDDVPSPTSSHGPNGDVPSPTSPHAPKGLVVGAFLLGLCLIVYGVLADIGWNHVADWLADRRNVTLLLFILGFIFAAIGAVGVILDVCNSIANTKKLGEDLASANDLRDEQHRSLLAEGRPVVRGFYASLTPDQLDDVIRQVGPPARAERDALVGFTNRANAVSSRKRWTFVGLLVGGIVVDLCANILSLYV